MILWIVDVLPICKKDARRVNVYTKVCESW